MSTTTSAQKERQEWRGARTGRYERSNPCYVCNKSLTNKYYSHRDTDGNEDGDINIGDALLVLCFRCCKHLDGFRGAAAVAESKVMRDRAVQNALHD